MCPPLSAQSVEMRDLLLRRSLDKEVYTIVEKQPEFPGGLDSLRTYLVNHTRYPEAAAKAKVAGRVLASFIVRKDGRIDTIEVLTGPGFGCDEEAIRIIKGMPQWKPGSQDGRLLNVKYHLPIYFGMPYPKPRK